MEQRRLTVVWLLFCAALAQADEVPRAKPATEPALQLELLRLVKADQEARAAYFQREKANNLGGENNLDALSPKIKAEFEKLISALQRVDRENTQRLREIVAKHGWPTRTLVDKDGSEAAWLLVQHADADPAFQRTCLDRMAKMPQHEVSQTDMAYLTDRVLLAEGKKQIYGTQFTSSGPRLVPRPLEDPANVDKRRAQVGLESLAEYVKELESMYGGPSKK